MRGVDVDGADFDAVLQDVDIIACPTSPTTAFPIGERVADPLSMYLADIFTLSLNLAGICGISVPCGLDGANLPIGLQLIGPALEEARLCRVAHAWEQISPVRGARAPRPGRAS